MRTGGASSGSAAEGGSVTRYTRNGFVTYTSAHGLPASVLWGFTGDEAGNLWVLSGEKILRWDPSRERFVDVDGPKVSRGYGIMAWSERGGFWAVAPEGLRRFVGGTFELHPIPQAVLADAVYLAEEQDGTLWTATTDGRVARIDTQMHAGFRASSTIRAGMRTHGG